MACKKNHGQAGSRNPGQLKNEEEESMKTSIYINESDAPLFARAKELAGDSLSPVIATALRRFVAAKEAELAGHQEITLHVGIWPAQGSPDAKKIRFSGRLLAEGVEYIGQTSDQRDRWREFEIYQTRGGNFIVHWSDKSLWEQDSDSADHAVMDRFPTGDQPVEGEGGSGVYIPRSVLEAAAAALGQELVEWVD